MLELSDMYVNRIVEMFCGVVEGNELMHQ